MGSSQVFKEVGDLNFPIYGQFLAAQQRQALPNITPNTPRGQNHFDKQKSPPYSNSNVCLNGISEVIATKHLAHMPTDASIVQDNIRKKLQGNWLNLIH